MLVPVYTSTAKESGKTIELKDDIFNSKVSEHAMYLDVKLLLANRRQGTHKVKTRGEVRGSTKKPYRQKGTGNARQGHKRSPLWRHGGTVHGPEPRNYTFSLNKKVRRLARRSALTLKAQNQKITVLDAPLMSKPKTKEFKSILDAFQYSGSKILLVTHDYNPNLYLSARNLPKVHIVHASQLNTYDIMNADRMLILPEAVSWVNENLA